MVLLAWASFRVDPVVLTRMPQVQAMDRNVPIASDSDENDFPPHRGIKQRLFQSPEPSVPVSELVGNVPVPEVVLSGIWSKAAQLLSMYDAISRAPGLDNLILC